MHYVEHQRGFPARITNHKTEFTHEDVNRLSRFVVKFNDWLSWQDTRFVNTEIEFKYRFEQVFQ